MVFKTQMKVHFDEADPAGIAFSGGLFTKMHRCYENFVEALDCNPEDFFLNPEVIFPVRHVEAEYFRPLKPLQTYPVEMSIAGLSDSSFQLLSQVRHGESTLCLTRSTHVCVNPKTMEKQPIPAGLRSSLENFLLPESR